MQCGATFFAIIKAYTTLNIFFLPIGFKNGGWLFSPIVLVIACFFETTCAVKVIQVAKKLEIYKYPDIVHYVLGTTYYHVFSVGLALLGFSFTLAPLAFFINTLYKLVKLAAEANDDPPAEKWIFAVIALVILAPLSWIRTVESFKVGFIFAVMVIFLLVITVSTLEL